jgi:predicted RND superfamily exporter protein
MVLALCVLIGLSLPKLSFDTDIHRAFLSGSALSQAQTAYVAALSPPLATLLIHVTAPAPFTAAQMTALRDLSLDLELSQGVTAVASPFVLRMSPGNDSPSGVPVFGAKIDGGYPAALAAFAALNTGLPTFLNPPLTAMLMAVTVDADQTTVDAAVTDLSVTLTRALPAGQTANITGEEVISSEIVTGLKEDLIALNMWGALVVALAAFALLRDLRMALLAVVPALLGAAAVLALSVWLGYPITVLSNVIPILLLILGVADGVHLAGSLKESRDIAATLRDVGPACALTALTTMVAFASVMLTDNVQLFEFAVLGTVGTMLSFAVVIVVFALLGRVVPLSTRKVPQISASMALRLTRFGAARPRLTVAICLAMLALG